MLPIFVSLIDLQLRAIHVILGISLASLAYPYRKSDQENEKISLWDLFVIDDDKSRAQAGIAALDLSSSKLETQSLNFGLGVKTGWWYR